MGWLVSIWHIALCGSTQRSATVYTLKDPTHDVASEDCEPGKCRGKLQRARQRRWDAINQREEHDLCEHLERQPSSRNRD